MSACLPVNRPRAVIFDVGNVLYTWDPHSFLARQIPQDDARRKFIHDVDLFRWHETLDGGRSFSDAAGELSNAFPSYAELISAWGANFGEMIKAPVPGVDSLVRDLHARDVPLFAVTNFSAEFWKPFYQREKTLFRLFRDIVVSGEVGLLKPDPAIFHLALERFALAPSETLFVDDREINVETASQIGMHVHLFTNADRLRATLVTLELLGTGIPED